MERTACLVYLVSTVSGHCKNILGRPSEYWVHKQNLSNLLFLDIYGLDTLLCLLFCSGGIPVLFACSKVMQFLPS
jgi:hypothetical protein